MMAAHQIEDLAKAVESQHGGRAAFAQSDPVTEVV